MLLVGFAFLAGVVTILSPCILPLLPIILGSSLGVPGRARPLGIVVGFVGSFTLATLFLTTLVNYLGISADSLRSLSILVLTIFGLTLVIPRLQLLFEVLSSRLASSTRGSTRPGFSGGILVGLSLGLLWTPCVGPILASVITLALSSSVSTSAFFITLAYALGTALPMLGIMYLGAVAMRLPVLVRYSATLQRSFGVLMVATAIALLFGFDRQFQSYILDQFPQYGTGLTKLEDNELVRQELSKTMEENMEKDLAPDLIAGGEWFNTTPLNLQELRGKVVLVDFWTYSCINCQRTLPYLKTWWERYEDKGLVIIGVHSPEFEFEKNPNNLAKAIADFDLKYPIMQDNNFATWKNYNNRYWPAKYLIDADGRIRYTHFGEGKYDETEAMIQTLLKERGVTELSRPSNSPAPKNNARTRETYLGTARSVPNQNLVFAGEWSYSTEYALPKKGATLTYKYNASDVYLVMRSTGEEGSVKVYVDDKLVKIVKVDSDTLYPLATDYPAGSHTLRLEFETDKLELYAFTFG